MKNLQALTALQTTLTATHGTSKKRKVEKLDIVPQENDDDDEQKAEYFVCLTGISATKKRGWSYTLTYIVCDGTENGKEVSGLYSELSKVYPELMADLAQGWATQECKEQVEHLITEGNLLQSQLSLCNIRYVRSERTLSKKQIRDRIALIQDGEADKIHYIADDLE